MPASSITRASNHSALRTAKDPCGLTMEEVVPYLVGHTVAEVERELIVHTLVHHCGSRTRSAHVLGISIRCLRIKIREYEEIGIAVPAPGEPHAPNQY
jgi:two-component system response regulator FlrC